MARTMKSKTNRFRGGAPCVVVCAATLAFAVPAGATTMQGSVFAPIDATPGYPQGMAVGKSRLYVAGPARVSKPGSGPSEILALHRKTGAVVQHIQVEGEDLSQNHALHGIAVDQRDRIYVLSTQLGLLRFSKYKKGYQQSVYAGPFPDLEPCSSAAPSEPCSPTDLALPPEPTDVAFAPDGAAYVTDATQATIYRIPPKGGAPEIWFQSKKIAGFFDLAGISGVRVSPAGDSLYLTVSFCSEAPWEGRIYELPLVDAPQEADLELVHAFENFEAPDGLAFGEDGALFVALSVTNEIAVIDPAAGETSRFSLPQTAKIPFDGPSHVAFDGKGGLFVTNLAAWSGVTPHFAVLAVDVGDRGADVFKPKLD